MNRRAFLITAAGALVATQLPELGEAHPLYPSFDGPPLPGATGETLAITGQAFDVQVGDVLTIAGSPSRWVVTRVARMNGVCVGWTCTPERYAPPIVDPDARQRPPQARYMPPPAVRRRGRWTPR